MNELLQEVVDHLAEVEGIEAIALGGSRAGGDHTPKSDFDIGIYYSQADKLALGSLDRVAAELDDSHATGLTTALGEWGPWINGGAWLTVDSQKVDFLYRDITKVSDMIAACHRGEIQIDYQVGHPHGFVSAIYMGEIDICRGLWDPHRVLESLKGQTRPYPRALQEVLINKFIWEAGFSLEVARKAIERGDVSYIAGCGFRTIACLLQVLFALNENYLLNEKGAIVKAEAFGIKPERFRERVEQTISSLNPEAESLGLALSELEKITKEVQGLVDRR